jgi:hypothetical protein
VSDGFVFLGDGAGAADLTAAIAAHNAASDPHGDRAASVAKALVDAKGDLLVGTAADTVGRQAVGGNGQVLVGDSAASTGLAYAPRDYDSLTAGEFIPARNLMTGNGIAVATQTLYLTYFTADKTETISTLTAFTGGTAAGATPTLCRYGIYTVAANGDLTLAASTPNDTALFAAANTDYPKGLSVALSKVAGQRYAHAILVVSGATMPTFHGVQLPATNPTNTFVRYAPAIVGRVTGQTDLPSPISAGSIIGYQGMVAMRLS